MTINRNKLSIFIVFAISGFILNACQTSVAQSEVPEAVQKAFKAKYPGENDPDFHMDDAGFWEASFKKDGEGFRADFNPDGTWVETENDIKKSEIPEAIQAVIKAQFDDEEITEVEHVLHHSKGEFYDVEFKKKGKNKDVEFRADGTIIN